MNQIRDAVLTLSLLGDGQELSTYLTNILPWILKEVAISANSNTGGEYIRLLNIAISRLRQNTSCRIDAIPILKLWIDLELDTMGNRFGLTLLKNIIPIILDITLNRVIDEAQCILLIHQLFNTLVINDRATRVAISIYILTLLKVLTYEEANKLISDCFIKNSYFLLVLIFHFGELALISPKEKDSDIVWGLSPKSWTPWKKKLIKYSITEVYELKCTLFNKFLVLFPSKLFILTALISISMAHGSKDELSIKALEYYKSQTNRVSWHTGNFESWELAPLLLTLCNRKNNILFTIIHKILKIEGLSLLYIENDFIIEERWSLQTTIFSHLINLATEILASSVQDFTFIYLSTYFSTICEHIFRITEYNGHCEIFINSLNLIALLSSKTLGIIGERVEEEIVTSDQTNRKCSLDFESFIMLCSSIDSLSNVLIRWGKITKSDFILIGNLLRTNEQFWYTFIKVLQNCITLQITIKTKILNRFDDEELNILDKYYELLVRVYEISKESNSLLGASNILNQISSLLSGFRKSVEYQNSVCKLFDSKLLALVIAIINYIWHISTNQMAMPFFHLLLSSIYKVFPSYHIYNYFIELFFRVTNSKLFLKTINLKPIIKTFSTSHSLLGQDKVDLLCNLSDFGIEETNFGDDFNIWLKDYIENNLLNNIILSDIILNNELLTISMFIQLIGDLTLGIFRKYKELVSTLTEFTEFIDTILGFSSIELLVELEESTKNLIILWIITISLKFIVESGYFNIENITECNFLNIVLGKLNKWFNKKFAKVLINSINDFEIALCVVFLHLLIYSEKQFLKNSSILQQNLYTIDLLEKKFEMKNILGLSEKCADFFYKLDWQKVWRYSYVNVPIFICSAITDLVLYKATITNSIKQKVGRYKKEIISDMEITLYDMIFLRSLFRLPEMNNLVHSTLLKINKTNCSNNKDLYFSIFSDIEDLESLNNSTSHLLNIVSGIYRDLLASLICDIYCINNAQEQLEKILKVLNKILGECMLSNNSKKFLYCHILKDLIILKTQTIINAQMVSSSESNTDYKLDIDPSWYISALSKNISCFYIINSKIAVKSLIFDILDSNNSNFRIILFNCLLTDSVALLENPGDIQNYCSYYLFVVATEYFAKQNGGVLKNQQLEFRQQIIKDILSLQLKLIKHISLNILNFQIETTENFSYLMKGLACCFHLVYSSSIGILSSIRQLLTTFGCELCQLFVKTEKVMNNKRKENTLESTFSCINMKFLTALAEISNILVMENMKYSICTIFFLLNSLFQFKLSMVQYFFNFCDIYGFAQLFIFSYHPNELLSDCISTLVSSLQNEEYNHNEELQKNILKICKDYLVPYTISNSNNLSSFNSIVFSDPYTICIIYTLYNILYLENTLSQGNIKWWVSLFYENFKFFWEINSLLVSVENLINKVSINGKFTGSQLIVRFNRILTILTVRYFQYSPEPELLQIYEILTLTHLKVFPNDNILILLHDMLQRLSNPQDSLNKKQDNENTYKFIQTIFIFLLKSEFSFISLNSIGTKEKSENNKLQNIDYINITINKATIIIVQINCLDKLILNLNNFIVKYIKASLENSCLKMISLNGFWVRTQSSAIYSAESIASILKSLNISLSTYISSDSFNNIVDITLLGLSPMINSKKFKCRETIQLYENFLLKYIQMEFKIHEDTGAMIQSKLFAKKVKLLIEYIENNLDLSESFVKTTAAYSFIFQFWETNLHLKIYNLSVFESPKIEEPKPYSSWQSLWTEICGSNILGINMYMDAICENIKWIIKKYRTVKNIRTIMSQIITFLCFAVINNNPSFTCDLSRILPTIKVVKNSFITTFNNQTKIFEIIRIFVELLIEPSVSNDGISWEIVALSSIKIMLLCTTSESQINDDIESLLNQKLLCMGKFDFTERDIAVIFTFSVHTLVNIFVIIHNSFILKILNTVYEFSLKHISNSNHTKHLVSSILCLQFISTWPVDPLDETYLGHFSHFDNKLNLGNGYNEFFNIILNIFELIAYPKTKITALVQQDNLNLFICHIIGSQLTKYRAKLLQDMDKISWKRLIELLLVTAFNKKLPLASNNAVEIITEIGIIIQITEQKEYLRYLHLVDALTLLSPEFLDQFSFKTDLSTIVNSENIWDQIYHLINCKTLVNHISVHKLNELRTVVFNINCNFKKSKIRNEKCIASG
ncbi:uncharacterized protein CMU_023290 [Cryptosporidium muris RN66]|uniref:Uncharacterized protein n=1 Tax=Cryptosporidium muris (strain RN66) TaxID=441375 RepID=B6ABX1_CRYMR|nr:uncharacterized protein CMU_023290 [Cryptosporidium muris RN66]EEA05324.1 hypothetical protein CMU_023290 [Cryptosporidium muris RN66]|eukprot:XP_002139673.1 hypothetical protein [Cryptosporidium muris RN66]